MGSCMGWFGCVGGVCWYVFFFSSRRRHTRYIGDWSSDVCSSDLIDMLQRLEQIEARYEELANELSAPELLADQTAYTKAARQHRNLGEIVDKYRTWKRSEERRVGKE